jgi:hypothetical protein
MQRIPRLQGAIGIKMEPALSSLIGRPRIPGDAERLQPPAAKIYEILLERRHSESVLDFEVCEHPARTVSADPEFPVTFEERSRDAIFAKERVAEVTQNGLSGGKVRKNIEWLD